MAGEYTGGGVARRRARVSSQSTRAGGFRQAGARLSCLLAPRPRTMRSARCRRARRACASAARNARSSRRMKLVEQELGAHHVAADIGCHLFSIMPPFNLGATTMGYGLGASARRRSTRSQSAPASRAIAFMGDGGFWHNGLTSGIGNAVFNKHDNVFVIVDNGYSAATGGQDILSSRASNPNRSTMHAIERAVRGVGVQWVRTIDAHLRRRRDARRAARGAHHQGARAEGGRSRRRECMLNRQRRERPATAAGGEGRQARREGTLRRRRRGLLRRSRLHALVGLPVSLTLAPSGDALKPDPVAHVDEHCVACGHCGEVADAAVLCPSFYKAHKVNNPTAAERWRARWRDRVIGWLQSRQQSARAQRALYPVDRAA